MIGWFLNFQPKSTIDLVHALFRDMGNVSRRGRDPPRYLGSYEVGRLSCMPAWRAECLKAAVTGQLNGRRNILVVDDDPLVCETLTMLLEFDGHAVKGATSAHHALALYEPGKFDLVITDFFMPAMNGDKLAAAIKTRDPHQAVIMATAYFEKMQEPGRPRMEVDLFIAKPFEMQSLRDAVNRCAGTIAR